MLQKLLDFIIKSWKDLVPIVLSVIAIFVSIRAEQHAKKFERQKEQEPLYADIQKMLKSKCDYFSSEMKVIGVYSSPQTVSEAEEETIKRKTRRVFGRKKYNKLCDILSLCSQAQNLNFDMNTLFDLIKESEPEEYMRLSENLQTLESDIPDSAKIKANNFLTTISIPYYQFTEEEPGKAYNFFELYNHLSSLDAQINEKKKSLYEDLKKAMMKN